MRVNRLASGSLASVVLLLAHPASAQSVWTIPGIVNVGGLNNTRFVSDVAMTNPGTAATQVSISFIPSSTANAKSVTLNAGETLVYRNVVDSLFGTSGAGALSISSAQPLLLRARTYNTAASGTYGVALPVYESDRLMTSGETGDSLWVSQDASGSSGYRTNIAVVFPDETGGAATVTVYDADGSQRGQKDYALDFAGFQQFSVGSFAGAVPVSRAQIHVTRGHAAGYSVVVDNVTGDSSLFTFEDLPGGIQDVLVNGVARANGRNGAFFRTDGRFYNPTDTDASIQVSFHASGNANPSPATASFTLPAGKIRDVVDVLDSLLGLPVGSVGALRFRSDWPVAILCRTSNVDPSGLRQGTFGSQQKPVPVLSFVTSADAGAAITGIRQDAAFRTNVGFAAGADGATYALTLATADGATVATTTASLGSFGWTQPGVQDLFPTVTIPQDATLRVKVTAGSVDVFDSSIDNLSGDPVVTPTAPLPTTIPSSATIGPQGGSIRSTDGRLTLRVPAGALASNVAMSVAATPSNDAPQASGPSYAISPGGVTFAKSATLVLRYDSEDLVGSNSGALGLAFKRGGRWFVATGGSVYAAARTLAVPITSTAPAAGIASSSRRPQAAASPDEWSPFRSIEIFPKKATITTGGNQTFLILATGSSSSASSGPGSAPLGEPVNVNELSFGWYVNGQLLGNGTEGVIFESNQSAQYTAPRCPPPANPVFIAVQIYTSEHRVISLTSKVRIVPRKWKLVIGPKYKVSCSDGNGDVSDDLRWGDASGTEASLPYVEFSLDDSLSATPAPVSYTTPAHQFGGCAKTCSQGGTVSIKNTGFPDNPLVISPFFSWIEDLDKMGVYVFLEYLGVVPLEDFLQSPILCTGGVQNATTSGAPEIWPSFGIFDSLYMVSGDSLTRSAPGQIGALTVTYVLKAVCP